MIPISLNVADYEAVAGILAEFAEALSNVAPIVAKQDTLSPVDQESLQLILEEVFAGIQSVVLCDTPQVLQSRLAQGRCSMQQMVALCADIEHGTSL